VPSSIEYGTKFHVQSHSPDIEAILPTAQPQAGYRVSIYYSIDVYKTATVMPAEINNYRKAKSSDRQQRAHYLRGSPKYAEFRFDETTKLEASSVAYLSRWS